jgi:hypothetical protein
MPNTLLKFQLPILFSVFLKPRTQQTPPQLITLFFFSKFEFLTFKKPILHVVKYETVCFQTEKRRAPPLGGASIDIGLRYYIFRYSDIVPYIGQAYSPQLLIQIYYGAEVVRQTTNGGFKKNRV